MAMPLANHADQLAEQAKKAGVPRSEREQEMMMGRAKDRAKGVGRSKENDLYHGHSTDSRSSISQVRAGKYGMTV